MANDPTEECFVFASFRLLPQQRTLLRDDEIVAIGGRAFDVLLLLASRAGEVVSLNELMNFVWPSVTVEEANLRVQMGILRKILSQCENAMRAIETVPLRGYCFILPVRHHPNGVEQAGHRAGRSQLPMLPAPPVGREQTVEIVAAALGERRLVTLTGPGGIGKTTVAIATAHRYAGRYAGEVIFVELSHLSNGDGVIPTIAQALGLDPSQGTLAALCEYFNARETLLILDTCEHIVDPIAEIVETMLAECGAIKLLATSREALRVTGEWTHRLASLDYPDEGDPVTGENIGDFSAITLFIERVRSSMRFAIADRDIPLLAEICRKLDGIPLALEFAAARVADLGLREIAAHLDDRFQFLTRGRRTALPRHRTLTAAFDWSYSLLADEEQHLLRHLAIAGSAFSAEGAVAVGRRFGCPAPAEILAGLYEKSLLSVDMRDDIPIYRILDTTRAYIAGKAKSAWPGPELVALPAPRVVRA